MRRVLLLILFAASVAVAEEPPLLSPRLRHLRDDLSKERAFWEERRAAGAPMIEASDAGAVLVTFLWRGDADTKNVFVIVLDQIQFSNAAYLERGRMARLDGSDVWYRTYRMPCSLRFSYRFSDGDRASGLRTDPLNPRHYASRSGDSSVAELPCADPQEALQPRDGIAHGTVSRDSFTGPSGEAHALQIYVPPSASKAPLDLVVLVGGEFTDAFPVPAILDNLIAAKKLRPALVVSIGFADMASYVKASRNDERFAKYVAAELVPWLRARHPLARDPRRCVIAGASAPGAAALFIGLRHPEVFGGVLSQSGAYAVPVPAAPDELFAFAHPETELLARELVTRPRLPLRVFLGVGVMDDVVYEGKSPVYAQPTVLVAARHLRDVLEAKGYPLRYREFGGGHEALAWRGSFAEGLTWLLRDER